MKSFTPIVLSLVVFILVLTLVETMVDGTDDGSVLIQNLAPILAGVGVVLTIIYSFLSGRSRG